MQTLSISRPVLRAPQRALPVPSAQADDRASDHLAAVCPSIDSTSLLRGGKSVQIEHNGAVYKLQATKLGKLILTK